jgi:hypothetical protein
MGRHLYGQFPPGAETAMCVHWIDLTAEPKVNSCDFGDASGSPWPSRWSIEAKTPTGTGYLTEHTIDNTRLFKSILKDYVRVFQSANDPFAIELQSSADIGRLYANDEFIFDYMQPTRLHTANSLLYDRLPRDPLQSLVLNGAVCIGTNPPWIYVLPIRDMIRPNRGVEHVADRLHEMSASAARGRVSGSEKAWIVRVERKNASPIVLPEDAAGVTIGPPSRDEIADTRSDRPARLNQQAMKNDPVAIQSDLTQPALLQPKLGRKLSDRWPVSTRKLVRRWPNTSKKPTTPTTPGLAASSTEWNVATVANNQTLVFKIRMQGRNFGPLIHLLPEQEFSRGSPLGSNNNQPMFGPTLNQWPTISGPAITDISIGTFLRPGSANTYDISKLVMPLDEGNTIAIQLKDTSISIFLNDNFIDAIDATTFSRFQLPVVVRCQAFFQSRGESIEILDCSTFSTE